MAVRAADPLKHLRAPMLLFGSIRGREKTQVIYGHVAVCWRQLCWHFNPLLDREGAWAESLTWKNRSAEPRPSGFKKPQLFSPLVRLTTVPVITTSTTTSLTTSTYPTTLNRTLWRLQTTSWRLPFRGNMRGSRSTEGRWAHAFSLHLPSACRLRVYAPVRRLSDRTFSHREGLRVMPWHREPKRTSHGEQFSPFAAGWAPGAEPRPDQGQARPDQLGPMFVRPQPERPDTRTSPENTERTWPASPTEPISRARSGVSGVASEQDAQVAKAGADALSK